MKSITIKGLKREIVGKVSTKSLRNAKKVPCVLYGGGKNIHFSADEIAFKKLVYTPDVHTVNIEFDTNETYNTILQDIQFHPVTDKILHIDFYQLFEDKEVILEIPVRIKGNSKGVLKGGVLRRNRRKLRVKALPKNLPDYIEVDISNLDIGGKLYVTDLEVNNFEFIHSDNTVVVQVRTSRVIAKSTEEEEEEELTEEKTQDSAVPTAEK